MASKFREAFQTCQANLGKVDTSEDPVAKEAEAAIEKVTLAAPSGGGGMADFIAKQKAKWTCGTCSLKNEKAAGGPIVDHIYCRRFSFAKLLSSQLYFRYGHLLIPDILFSPHSQESALPAKPPTLTRPLKPLKTPLPPPLLLLSSLSESRPLLLLPPSLSELEALSRASVLLQQVGSG